MTPQYHEFLQETEKTARTAARLRHVMENMTAVKCPVAPCDDCVLDDCALREPPKRRAGR